MACWLVYNVRISYILINISLAPSFSAPFPKQYSIKPACCLAHSAPGGLIIRTWVGTLRGSSPRCAAPDAPGPVPGLGGSLPCAACQRGPGCVPLASLLPAQWGQAAPPAQDPPGVSPASPHRAPPGAGAAGAGAAVTAGAGSACPCSAHTWPHVQPPHCCRSWKCCSGRAAQSETAPDLGACIYLCASGAGREKQRSFSSTKQVIRLHTANLL